MISDWHLLITLIEIILIKKKKKKPNKIPICHCKTDFFNTMQRSEILDISDKPETDRFPS